MGDQNTQTAGIDEERDLIARARSGDSDALGDLFTIHSPGVRRLLRSVMGPAADLDDLTQDVFLQVHRSIRNYRSDSRFSTWLHRVTVNTAMSHLRSLARRDLPTEPLKIADRQTDAAPNAHESAVGKEMVARLYRILDTLSAKRRTAFVLFEIEGNSLLDLARILGVSRATAKSRVWFARREIYRKAADDPYLGPLLEELKK